LDAVEKTIQRATRKAKDGKIDITDFLNEAATARNSVFTPLEASIIFYLASRGAHETVFVGCKGEFNSGNMS
jgi:solute carrier family 25 aspartate/glutamate transporter 12/13